MFRLGAAEQVQHQPADGVGRAPAIVEQFRVIGIAFLDHVLREGVEQVAKELDGQGMGGNHLGQFDEQRCLRRRSGSDPVQFGVVGGQSGQSLLGGRIALVGDVVGAARKAVDRLDRLAQAGRHEQRGNGKIFVMIDGHGNLVWRRGLSRC